MSRTCGICTDSFNHSQMTRVCECHSYCPSCLEAEGEQIFQNRGSPTELTRMLNCTTCSVSKDIEIYPLSEIQKRQIVESTAERSEHAESPQEEDVQDEDDIGIYYNRCPGCNIRIEKDGGCNHMTHRNCPGRGGADVHFCDCCNQEVYEGHGRWEDDEGRNHFPNGVFEDCIEVDVDQDENDQYNNRNIINNDNINNYNYNQQNIINYNNNYNNNNYNNYNNNNYNNYNNNNYNDDDDDIHDNFQIGDRISGADFNGDYHYGQILRWSNNGNPVIDIGNNGYIEERTLVRDSIQLINNNYDDNDDDDDDDDNNNNNNNLNNIQCYNCQGWGHYQNNCPTNYNVNIQCYNCNQYGHFQANCPLIQCFNCNGYGHLSRNCNN